jgi:transcriptional regulator with XRE-family HTH domain
MTKERKRLFGGKLRAIREKRGLTLKEVAEKAGVSESLVSQIERNRVSPAIDTLLGLAEVLDLDLEYLFSDYYRDRGLYVVRKTERTGFSKPGVRYERLARMEGIEAYYITLDAGAKTGSLEYGHAGWELGIVEEGNAEISVGNETHVLRAGDSISFRSESPHVVTNRGKKPLRVCWIVTPPKGEGGMGI